MRRQSTGQEVHYFIGPIRETLEEAEADRKRWERGGEATVAPQETADHEADCECLRCTAGRNAEAALERKEQNLLTATKRGCNRHADCRAAESAYRQEYGTEPGYNFHCHDDCCEDCFGS